MDRLTRRLPEASPKNAAPPVHLAEVLKEKRVLVIAAAATLVIAAVAIFFFTRAPVVVAADAAFTSLYGRRRAGFSQMSLSLKLFRPVKTASIAENAGPDMVMVTVWGASHRPFAVFFPYRYREGALRYAREHPGIRLAVLAGRETPGRDSLPPETAWFTTDSSTDLYRAGYCAGFLAAKGKDAAENRQILVLQERIPVPDRDREAFMRGLEAYQSGGSGSKGADLPARTQFAGPDWVFTRRETPDGLNLPACAVISGGAEGFFQEDISIPLVFFTWQEPAFLPDETVLVFDDSPWALIPRALVMLENGSRNGAIPSAVRGIDPARPVSFSGFIRRLLRPSPRILPKEVVARVKKLNLTENTADN
jgi:hypothetical protein